MKVYCGHQITGLSPREVFDYYDRVRKDLAGLGYHVLSPMTAKEQFDRADEPEFKSTGYTGTAGDHAIVERDCWMVQQADIVFMNLLGMTRASIGCTSELAWAYLLRKHVVLVMEKENIHQHAFIKEMADIVFETYERGVDYLRKLGGT
jgi:nucleoside 2-deoxyribosyltransferase